MASSAEDERLDGSEQQLQAEEDGRYEERQRQDEDGGGGERQHGAEQHFAGEDVAEESH